MGPMAMVIEVCGVVILSHKVPATDVIDIAVDIIIDTGSPIQLRIIGPNIVFRSVIEVRVVICNPGIDHGDDHIR